MSEEEEKLKARLLSRSVRTLDGCLEWQGAKVRGYGYITIRARGRVMKVHRLAYELWVGPLLDNMVIMHICDNPPCFEPAHLRQGATHQNVMDAFEKGRRQAPPAFLAANPFRGKTHCPQGHEYNEINTYHYKGGRKCRPCHAARERRRRDARRLENPS